MSNDGIIRNDSFSPTKRWAVILSIYIPARVSYRNSHPDPDNVTRFVAFSTPKYVMEGINSAECLPEITKFSRCIITL